MALTEVNSLGIKDLEVKTGDIAADAITGAKIADDAIDSEHYVDGSIDNAHLADDAVGTAEIADDAITNALMADDAVGVAQLSATGTASSSTFLRGDNAWAAAGGGKVIAVYGLTTTGNQSATNSTWVDTELTLTVTPASVDSKFVIGISQTINILDTSSNSTRGGWRLVRAIDGGTASPLTGDNAGVVQVECGATGQIQTTGKYAINLLDDPNTTSDITYHTEIMESQGNTTITSGSNPGSSMFILEIDS